ncbi:Cytochrome C biogenesis protein transmembrane region [Nitratireductor indicus]|nr:Cytochrome C biogenesis protein transmembrane region [Nitratireductor indicus]
MAIDVSAIGLLTAILAGAISFVSPCVLPLVPGYLSFVSSGVDPASKRLADRIKVVGFVATADLKRKGGRSEANYAARIANCSARDGFGLKAYLACRLRIM